MGFLKNLFQKDQMLGQAGLDIFKKGKVKKPKKQSDPYVERAEKVNKSIEENKEIPPYSFEAYKREFKK